MPDKSFEQTVPFYEVQTPQGLISLPLVTVSLIQPGGNRVGLSLLFDTGASTTTLREDLYFLLGVPSWDSGQPRQVSTAGGATPVMAYRYPARLELFGKIVDCPIQLQVLPRNPLYVGLLGREQLFEAFGFGFWESTQELYVTSTP